MKTIYKLSVLVFALLGGTKFFAQNSNAKLAKIAFTKNNTDWVKFKANNLKAESIFTDNKEAFGLSANDNMHLLKKETDELGATHYRYQQVYKSIPIEGADYIVHEQNGFATRSNGKIIRNLDINTNPSITEKSAISTAINYVNADAYMWEDLAAERMLKRINKDPNASFYPKAELVIAKNFAGDASPYQLAYKINIMASAPISGQTIYVDALTGKVFSTLNLIETTEVPATAVTKYSGNQTIMVDSVAPNLFHLREHTRGLGIETYNVNKTVKYLGATDFIDTDNYWDNVNAAKDEIATDAHWGAEMTYDYYFQKHNRNSFNNQGGLLVSYVHFSNNYLNAFWNGSWMTYGDGNNTYSPLTTIDICAHELTHGVTGNSAKLIYQNESGALNESFSDVFGTSVEFFAKPSTANWLIGEQLGAPFRSMLDPNAYNNPDTYKGKFWAIGAADEGGVHTNSGVQNFWFYLLSIGGTGTNDNGDSYTVAGIGIDKAAKIAYRNLTVYMTSTSQYYDARQGAISAAEDLYGICSYEAIQTANAWYAVGVGDPISNVDMGLINITSAKTACGLTNSENVKIQLRYNGCSTFPLGDSIPVAYTINNGTPIRDTIILTSALLPGDSLSHTFTSPANLSAIGIYTIKSWLQVSTDTLNFNDTLTIKVENKLAQNIDVGIVAINSPKNSCQLTAAEPVDIKLKFYGCDSLKANDSIVVAYRVNGGSIEKDTVILVAPLYTNQTINYTFKKKIDMSAISTYNIDTWINYSKDTLNKNDTLKEYKISNPYLMDHKLITFEDITNVVDSLYIVTNAMSQVSVSTTAKNTGVYGLQMTGGNWYNNRGQYKTLNDLTTWTVNDDFSAEACFCIDATAWTHANLKFDLKQTFNNIYSANRGYLYPYSSNLRILVNGIQIGNNYNPVTKKSDPYVSYFVNLDSFAKTRFEVCFQTKNYQSKAYDSSPAAIGDNAYLDNIYFSENSIVNVKENTVSNNNFEVFPNPGKDLFTVSYLSKNTETITIELTDVLGRKIITQKCNVISGINKIPVEIKDQKNGIYFMRIQSIGNMGVKKLIIE